MSVTNHNKNGLRQVTELREKTKYKKVILVNVKEGFKCTFFVLVVLDRIWLRQFSLYFHLCPAFDRVTEHFDNLKNTYLFQFSSVKKVFYCKSSYQKTYKRQFLFFHCTHLDRLLLGRLMIPLLTQKVCKDKTNYPDLHHWQGVWNLLNKLMWEYFKGCWQFCLGNGHDRTFPNLYKEISKWKSLFECLLISISSSLNWNKMSQCCHYVCLLIWDN